MKTRPGSVSHLVTPLKAIADRFAFSALVLLSVAVMVIGKADPSLVQRVRASVNDAAAPVLEVLGKPVTALTNAGTYLRDILTAASDNQRLREENETLLQWQQVARRLEAENAALRGLMKYQPEPTTWFVTAKVIGTAGGAFTRNLLVNRGSEDHLVTGQAAASGTGLVGRVMEVGQKAARVLLITDINSRIPVTVDTTHDRGILAGDNTDRPELLYLPPHSKIAVGDHIVTSGDGGVFPPGLPVGTVSAIEGSKIRIEPMADLSRIDYLRIIDFGLAGMLPPDAVPAPKAPKHAAAPHKP